jgi:hypothetical protein
MEEDTMNLNPVWILYGVAALAALVLVVRFGKLLVWGVLLIGGIGAILLLASTTRQQAQATQQAVTAATLASAGQTTSSVGITILAVLLVLLLLGAGGVILVQRVKLRRIEQEMPRWREYPPPFTRPHENAWLPGPNAHWQRAQPNSGDPLGQMLQGLLQLELLRALREMRTGGPRATGFGREYRFLEEAPPYEGYDDESEEWF